MDEGLFLALFKQKCDSIKHMQISGTDKRKDCAMGSTGLIFTEYHS